MWYDDKQSFYGIHPVNIWNGKEVEGAVKRWKRLFLPVAAVLLLSGCLFRPPDDLYKLPEKSAGYEKLNASIRAVRSGLEAEYGISSELAVIVSGDNTATIQLQDLDGDGVRESAVTFIRVPGIEKAIKIYVFQQVGEDYVAAGIVEGDGAAIYSIDYVDLNGTGSKEIVVNWQISAGVYQLGAYTLDELSAPAEQKGPQGPASNAALPGGNSGLVATELLLTGCSGAVDGSSGYRLLDIDRDTHTEIAVVRIDSAGVGSQVEVYGWRDGAFVSLSSAGLSSGVVSLVRLRANYLNGEYYPPALYVICALSDGSRTIDVLSFQERSLVNLSLIGQDSGVSRNVLRGYIEVSPADINGDYILELPAPRRLPSMSEAVTSNFWLIDWSQYDEAGNCTQVLTTYHNVQDAWYLIVPEEWTDKITISRNDSLSGQREVVFSLWQGAGKEPIPFLSIYRLTGTNRASRAGYEGRFILREEESVIYAAAFYECGWDCGLDQTDLLENFNTIQASWYNE